MPMVGGSVSLPSSRIKPFRPPPCHPPVLSSRHWHIFPPQLLATHPIPGECDSSFGTLRPLSSLPSPRFPFTVARCHPRHRRCSPCQGRRRRTRRETDLSRTRSARGASPSVSTTLAASQTPHRDTSRTTLRRSFVAIPHTALQLSVGGQ